MQTEPSSRGKFCFYIELNIRKTKSNINPFIKKKQNISYEFATCVARSTKLHCACTCRLGKKAPNLHNYVYIFIHIDNFINIFFYVQLNKALTLFINKP